MPMHYATSSAIHQLNRWVRTGVAPRATPRYRFEGGTLAVDEHGNTRGGIRLPPVEVPVATYESTLCNLGGITVPFTDPRFSSSTRRSPTTGAGWRRPPTGRSARAGCCRPTPATRCAGSARSGPLPRGRAGTVRPVPSPGLRLGTALTPARPRVTGLLEQRDNREQQSRSTRHHLHSLAGTESRGQSQEVSRASRCRPRAPQGGGGHCLALSLRNAYAHALACGFTTPPPNFGPNSPRCRPVPRGQLTTHTHDPLRLDAASLRPVGRAALGAPGVRSVQRATHPSSGRHLCMSPCRTAHR